MSPSTIEPSRNPSHERPARLSLRFRHDRHLFRRRAALDHRRIAVFAPPRQERRPRPQHDRLAQRPGHALLHHRARRRQARLVGLRRHLRMEGEKSPDLRRGAAGGFQSPFTYRSRRRDQGCRRPLPRKAPPPGPFLGASRLAQRPERPRLCEWRVSPLLPAQSLWHQMGEHALGARREPRSAPLAGASRGPLSRQVRPDVLRLGQSSIAATRAGWARERIPP